MKVSVALAWAPSAAAISSLGSTRSSPQGRADRLARLARQSLPQISAPVDATRPHAIRPQCRRDNKSTSRIPGAGQLVTPAPLGFKFFMRQQSMTRPRRLGRRPRPGRVKQAWTSSDGDPDTAIDRGTSATEGHRARRVAQAAKPRGLLWRLGAGRSCCRVLGQREGLACARDGVARGKQAGSVVTHDCSEFE